jgi:hypothetical protein
MNASDFSFTNPNLGQIYSDVKVPFILSANTLEQVTPGCFWNGNIEMDKYTPYKLTITAKLLMEASDSEPYIYIARNNSSYRQEYKRVFIDSFELKDYEITISKKKNIELTFGILFSGSRGIY